MAEKSVSLRIASLTLVATTIFSACRTLGAAEGPAPDLIVRNVYIEMQGRQGNCVEAYTPYEIRVAVENIGQAAAGPFSVSVNGAVQEVKDGLAIGQMLVLHFNANAPGGRYEARIDPLGQVSEAREDNNALDYLAPTPTPPALCTPTVVPTP